MDKYTLKTKKEIEESIAEKKRQGTLCYCSACFCPIEIKGEDKYNIRPKKCPHCGVENNTIKRFPVWGK